MKNKRRTPKETLHEWCHYCIQSRLDDDVKDCGGDFIIATGKPCPFYNFRMGDKRPPIKLFREFCLECMGGRSDFVRECETADCQIHPYRLGRNMARTGKGASKERMLEISRIRKVLSR